MIDPTNAIDILDWKRQCFKHGITDPNIVILINAYNEAKKEVDFLNNRHALILRWLKRRAEDERMLIQLVPDPCGFDPHPDPEYLTDLIYGIEKANTNHRGAAEFYDYIHEAIENGTKQLRERQEPPSNEYTI